MSGAAILRRQTTGTITMTNARKMFDESQMVRQVRAYLASIKSNIVTDEDYLLEMSNQCEASAQHSAPQPGQLSSTDHGRRRTQKVGGRGVDPGGGYILLKGPCINRAPSIIKLQNVHPCQSVMKIMKCLPVQNFTS